MPLLPLPSELLEILKNRFEWNPENLSHIAPAKKTKLLQHLDFMHIRYVKPLLLLNLPWKNRFLWTTIVTPVFAVVMKTYADNSQGTGEMVY